MYQRAIGTWAMAAAMVLIAASSGIAGEAFCAAYAQTWSSAGRCGACRLKVTPTETQTYRVEANNGWKAEVGRGGRGVAEGKGSWSANMRNAYAGKSFKIALARTGKKLTMAMLVQLDGKQKIVVANFRCLDNDFAGLPGTALR